MEVIFQYTKKRSGFGRQPLYSEAGPVMCDSIPTAPLEQRHYVLRNPVHQAVQHTPVFSEHHINTFCAKKISTGANHSEGGWPKDVQYTDPEATQRYRRKIEKEDSYIHCVTSTSDAVDHYILQNNAIDMYGVYFLNMAQSNRSDAGSSRIVNVYRMPAPAQPVSSVCWQPEAGRQFAVTHLDVDPTRLVGTPFYSYIWDAEKANEPTLRLQPPCPLLDLQYNPREQETLAAGLLSGQVAAWDTRAGPLLQLISEPHAAHRDLVRKVLFINAKSGKELFSAGPDGTCKWWDLRALAEPTDELIIDVVKNNEEPSMARANGVSTLEFEPTIPTRFMVGTENGMVLAGNRKGKTPADKLPVKFEAHVGSVYSLQRNPGFLKNFLTVGDFTARVWSEDCRESAVLWTPPQRHKLNAGCWSPTRTSLVLLAQSDGVLALWDLLRCQHAPALTMQVCEESLTTVVPHDVGQLVALGSERGSIYMIELSRSLVQTDTHDKAYLNAIFEREAKRERILEARLREIKLKLKQEAEGGGSPTGGASAVELEATLGDRDLADATAVYFQEVKKQLSNY